MDMTLVIILVTLLFIAFFIINEISIGKIRAEKDVIMRRLIELEDKEIQNGIVRSEYHFMKKYFNKIYPDAFKKP